MRRSEQQPLIPEKLLMPIRLAVVVLGYVLYRWLEDRYSIAASLFVAAGTIMVAYALVNRYGLWRRDRMGLLQVGQTILGLGLIGIGIYLIST